MVVRLPEIISMIPAQFINGYIRFIGAYTYGDLLPVINMFKSIQVFKRSLSPNRVHTSVYLILYPIVNHYTKGKQAWCLKILTIMQAD